MVAVKLLCHSQAGFQGVALLVSKNQSPRQRELFSDRTFATEVCQSREERSVVCLHSEGHKIHLLPLTVFMSL